MIETHTFINLEKPQIFTINDGAQCECHGYQIVTLAFHKCNHTMQINPNFEGNYSSKITIFCPFISFTSNKSIIICA
jgi:hypothetical protein